MKKSKFFTYGIATALSAFALLTLFLSSSVLFDWFGIRAKEGNYVPFIVWANFICSIFYFMAVYGFLKFEKWTLMVLIVSILILIIALIGLYFHINAGGLYEIKTIGAMFFRIGITLVFTIVIYLLIRRKT